MSEPRAVSYSELSAFRQCPMKWELGYLKGYKPEREKEAFRLGHVWHSIMETHYSVIREYQADPYNEKHVSPNRGAIAERGLLEHCAREVGYAVMDGLDDETRTLMEWAYSGYVAEYGCDPQWRILAIEIRGEVPLDGDQNIVFVIDLVVEDLDYGGTWIVDHKFPGDLSSDTEIDLDDQLGIYWQAWILWARSHSDELASRVTGAMLNETRKRRNKGDMPGAIAAWERVKAAGGKPGVKPKAQTSAQRFQRCRTSRTAEEAKQVFADAMKTVKAMTLLRENDLLFPSPDPKQCGWKCDFKEAHIFSRGGLPIAEVLSDFGFKSREERESAEDS